MINRIKEALDLKTNRELSIKLNVNESTVSRWNKKGFHASTERLIILLLEKIDKPNKPKYKGVEGKGEECQRGNSDKNK